VGLVLLSQHGPRRFTAVHFVSTARTVFVTAQQCPERDGSSAPNMRAKDVTDTLDLALAGMPVLRSGHVIHKTSTAQPLRLQCVSCNHGIGGGKWTTAPKKVRLGWTANGYRAKALFGATRVGAPYHPQNPGKHPFSGHCYANTLNSSGTLPPDPKKPASCLENYFLPGDL